ncbi:MAG: hypothetical protein KF768_13160 [Phycisphaeraceae bacterium]|nr:hypothetical protein [Phycisphaeraceae bacterium]
MTKKMKPDRSSGRLIVLGLVIAVCVAGVVYLVFFTQGAPGGEQLETPIPAAGEVDGEIPSPFRNNPEAGKDEDGAPTTRLGPGAGS